MTAERDEEILRLLEQELSQRTVAIRLGISESTVSRAWRRAESRRRQAQAIVIKDYCDEHD